MATFRRDITEFANGVASSHALPVTLSADERREAKTFATQCGLHTMSTGVGQDRQLHLLRGSPNPQKKCEEDAKYPINTVVEIKNTFIHFEDPIAKEDTEREIWTMPVGALQSELARELRDREKHFVSKSGQDWVGSVVELTGLRDYHGAIGTVDSFDENEAKFNVRLTDDRCVRVLAENLIRQDMQPDIKQEDLSTQFVDAQPSTSSRADLSPRVGDDSQRSASEKFSISLDLLVAPRPTVEGPTAPIQLDSLVSSSPKHMAPPSDASSTSGMPLVFNDGMDDPKWPE